MQKEKRETSGIVYMTTYVYDSAVVIEDGMSRYRTTAYEC